jgi:hypothetical protein
MKKKSSKNTSSRIDLGGINSDGPNYKNIGFKLPHTYAMKSPDSMISQRMQNTMPKDYYEDPNMLEEDEETLEEFFARIMKMPLTENDKKDLIDEDEENKEEEGVDEMSAGGVPGVAVTMGLGPDGQKRKKGWKSKFDKFSKRMFGGGK